MSLLTIIGSVLGGVKDTVLPFIDTPDKKKAFELALKKAESEAVAKAEESYQVELTARADIIKAEMEHGNNYTKNARPTIIYAGLVFTAIVHVIVPIVGYIAALSGNIVKDLPELSLPGEFWWAWGTVVSVYGAGRTAEKYGAKNKLTSLITGSKH